MATGSSVSAACAVVTLCFAAACGAGAAVPTPTVVPVSAVSPVAVPSPQRPALASPVASPSSPSTSPAAPTAAAATAAGDTYEVQSGDTLATIADHFYGDNTQWRRIYDANKDVIGDDPDKLKIGMQLKIPPKQ